MLIPSKHAGYAAGIRLYPGGKGSDAPAPDPRLVEAQIKSMGIQDDAIKQILSNAGDLMPLQKDQMQFGLDAARTAYGQSQQDREFALGQRGKLAGLTDSIVSEARGFNADDRRADLVGQVNADVTGAFNTARTSMARDMARSGVNPADGRYAGMSRQMASDEALAKVLGARKATDSARVEGMQLKSNAANILSGYPGMAAGLTGSGASYGGQGLNVVNAGLAGANSGYGSAAQIAGQMGTSATGMWNAQANYKTQQDRQDGSILGGLGALAGGAAKIIPFFL